MGCPSRAEIEAAAWLNVALPKSACDANPVLKTYGVYRKLNTGKYEFLSYCDPTIVHWISFYDQDLKRMLDATIQNPK